MKTTGKFAGMIFLFAVCLPASGCHILGVPFSFMTHKEYTMVPAEYDLESLSGSSILVVPFKEKEGFYFKSQKGRDLARLVELRVRTNLKNMLPVSSNKVLESESPLRLETANWASTGKALGADYILLGEISLFRTKDPGALNMLMGKSVINVELLAVREEAKIVWSKKINSKFPEDVGELGGVSEFHMDEETIHEGLLLRAAKDIVNNFYKRKVKRFEVGREEIYK